MRWALARRGATGPGRLCFRASALASAPLCFRASHQHRGTWDCQSHQRDSLDKATCITRQPSWGGTVLPFPPSPKSSIGPVLGEQDTPGRDSVWTPLLRPSAAQGRVCIPQAPTLKASARCGGRQSRGMPPTQPHPLHLLLFLLLVCQPQASSAQVMDFLFEKWKLYSDQCHRNLSLLPAPTELVCNRTFDKYSCWPDTPPNTTANISCPWYLPWYHKVQHRLVFKKCGPDGQWVRGPHGQPWRNASQCQMDDQEIEVQNEVAKMYSSFQVMYTVGYSLSLAALLLALAILLGLSKLHCTRNYIHLNLFASFVLKAGSVLVIDRLLETRYSQKIGDDLSVSVWLSDGAVAGCRVAAVIMQYAVVANYCWLLVEGVYLHRLLSLAAFPEQGCFALYLATGWGAPLLFVIPWVVVKCLFENIQCWTSNNNMGFWWILRVPVFLAILGLLVAVLYCFLNKEVQAELWRRWQCWYQGKALLDERITGSHLAPTGPSHSPLCEKLQLVKGASSNGAGQDPSAETPLASGLPGLAKSPF
ncbi:glucagon receptor isoform X10 [Cavia porcellus]|uniref:glucagon receptor isoform X10 n=1 Tax=Cavia porcellus TaxID=10141 RepID=UPI0006619A37|nr:glucagon receptor isoform X3 [Cavia porcellus]